MWTPFTIYSFILGLTDHKATKETISVVDPSIKTKPVQCLTTLPVQTIWW
jgi:hypothetical protein